MNIAMEQTQEYVNGQLKGSYADTFIRGNNGTPEEPSQPDWPLIDARSVVHSTPKVEKELRHDVVYKVRYFSS